MKNHALRCRCSFVAALILVSVSFAQVPRGNPPAPAPVPPAPVPVSPAPVQPQPPQPPTAGGNNGGNNNGGAAIDGLTSAQLFDFLDGRADFRETATVATGLGPIFNDNSCVACHNAGGTGGAGRRTVTRFGRTTNGVFDPLSELGGSLLQERAIDPAVREVVPAQANTRAQRLTTPLFGAGLIEAIPDATITLGLFANKPAGITGKVSMVKDVASGANRVGRFGWKAQQATLLAFSGDAYLNEMGITNRLFPTENAPNGATALLARFVRGTGIDDAADTETGSSKTDRVAAYMRMLAPPPRGATNASTTAGERIFARVDCAACHTPTMTTGTSSVAALNEKTVALYSDLLLHDMGALGDGIAQGAAGARDMRTAPLWGLRQRPTWLHDGRAQTVDEAIRGHAGEAQNSRDAYARLTAQERQQLLDFLNSL